MDNCLFEWEQDGFLTLPAVLETLESLLIFSLWSFVRLWFPRPMIDWSSSQASLLIDKALPGTPLAFVCSACASPFVRDSQAGRLWRQAVTSGVNIEGPAVALLAAAPLRKCAVSGPADSRGVPTGTCSVCYLRARKRASLGAQDRPSGGRQALETARLPGCHVPPPPPLETVWVPGVDVAPLPWRAPADRAARVSGTVRASDSGEEPLRDGPVGKADRRVTVALVGNGRVAATLLNDYLAATRPGTIKVTFGNGSVRIYQRETIPRKAEVGPRQKRRRVAEAAAAVGRVLGAEPGLLVATVEDLCRRARQSGGVVVAPAAAALAPPSVRLQTQFILDNNISRTLWQRVRLFLGGPASGLASREVLRRDLGEAQAEERNQVTSDGAGAFLVTPRAAVQGLIGDLLASGEFLERATRGRDGKEIEAVSAFEGQDCPGAVPDPKVRDVQLCFGLDKGGQLSSCKAILSILNQEHPCSRGNTILYGVFPSKKDDHDALSRMADVYVPDIDALRMDGVEVSGERRAVRLILTGDYSFVTLWCGHMGASSRMPCLYCTAMRCRTARNGLLVDKYGDMQAGSKARGAPRTRQHLEKMAEAYQDGDNASRGTPLSLKEHLSIERRPLLILDPSHISPMPLHLVLGVTVWLLRLGIEAVYFYNGLARARLYAQDLARVLRYAVGVKPKPYFGGAFEGRQCQRIGRRLAVVCTLLEGSVPHRVSTAYADACATWRQLLPVLTTVATIPKDDVALFKRNAAQLVDGLKRHFEWSSVTPKLHVLACHAPDFLSLFGSLGRYSEQGLEAWHGHYNQNASQYAADTFLESCLAYVRRVAVSRAPGDGAYNRGVRRASAPEGARVAKSMTDKRTAVGRAAAGGPRLDSASCAQKQADEAAKWAADNLALAVRKIDSYRRRVGGPQTEAGTDDCPSDEEDHYEELLEAETACLMSLGQD